MQKMYKRLRLGLGFMGNGIIGNGNYMKRDVAKPSLSTARFDGVISDSFILGI